MTLDLLVIGAGPAGVAAACEASRLGACCAIVDAAGEAGGTIRLAHEARNIPFLEDPVSGEAVASHLRRMAKGRCSIERARITSVEALPLTLSARASNARVFESRCVIVATGTRPLVPQIPGLPDLLESPWTEFSPGLDPGRGNAAIIGAGDVAFDHARALQRRGIQTMVLCRSARPRAPRWLSDRARAEGVEVVCDAVVESAIAREQSVRLSLRVSGLSQTREVEMIVPAVGRLPCVPQGVDLLPQNRVRVVGDAAGRRARHVAIAMGEGCLAAFELLQAERER